MIAHILTTLVSAAIVAGLVHAAMTKRTALPAEPRAWSAVILFWLLLAAGLFLPWARVAERVPELLAWPLRDWIDGLIGWLVANLGPVLRGVSDGLLFLLAGLDQFVREQVPWWAITAVAAGLGYHASRRLTVASGVAAALVFILSLGLWDLAMQTLSLMILSIALCIVLGLPLGVTMARRNRVRAVVLPVLDFMQTMPSFVYLIPAVMLFGLGKVSAIIATVIYAVPPLIRLTDIGIRQVDGEVLDAGRAFGANGRQLLFGIQLPLARPAIMAGVNQCIMMSLAMVVIASMIGVSGLGQEVLQGLQRLEAGTGFAAGVAIVLLAIILDRITQAYGRRQDVARGRG